MREQIRTSVVIEIIGRQIEGDDSELTKPFGAGLHWVG